MRAALDTDVVVAALRSRKGASRFLIEKLADGAFVAVASINMMLEYESVLMRPEHLSAARLTAEEMSKVVDGLAAVMEPVTPFFLWRPQLRDPNDEMVLDAAVNGSCDAIVTFNRRHFETAAGRFGLQILSPAEAARRLR